jgi:hypothetical protein
VNYASGSVYGVVWGDNVWIDGNGVSIGVIDNPVECAQNVGGDTLPALTAVDGIFGLNLWVNDSEAPIPQETWFSYLSSNLSCESNNDYGGRLANFASANFYRLPCPERNRNYGLRLH